MLHTLQTLFGTAVMERAVLLVNHVLASEPVATARLAGHAGRRLELQFEGWPAVLPALPATAFLITPAGLIEWCGEGRQAGVPTGVSGSAANAAMEGAATAAAAAPADLQISIDASNPLLAAAKALGGERPRIRVAGDARLATDVNWLFDNLRWDIEDDLAALVGPAPAREAARLGGAVAAALREAVQKIGAIAERRRGGGQHDR